MTPIQFQFLFVSLAFLMAYFKAKLKEMVTKHLPGSDHSEYKIARQMTTNKFMLNILLGSFFDDVSEGRVLSSMLLACHYICYSLRLIAYNTAYPRALITTITRRLQGCRYSHN